MTIEENFQKAAQDVQSLPQKPSNDDLLDLYSLFKQAEVGPATGKRPGALNIIARKKYDQWSALGQMTKSDAMEKYIAKVKFLQNGN